MSNILLVLTGFLFFCYGVAFSQVSVVQYNSSWNSDNSFDITVLKDCKLDSIIICNNPEIKKEYKIISVPTVIIFDNGVEKERFAANIMFQLEAEKKDVQSKVDEIILNNFN